MARYRFIGCQARSVAKITGVCRCVVLAMAISSPAYAQPDAAVAAPQTQTVDQNQAAADEAARQAAALAVPAQHYHNCVRGVLSGATPTIDKQALMDEQCEQQRADMKAVIPEALQDYILLNIDRRINNLLKALLASEAVFADTIEDTAAVVEVLAADERIVE